MYRAFVVALVATVVLPATASAAAPFASPDRPGPALSVPAAKLDSRLGCSAQALDNGPAPVLLLQGTGATAKDNWSWTYEPALTKRGIPWCHMDLPDHATSDIQVAGEHVVHAIRTMHAAAGKRIAIIGHSQGGMVGRWALRFWPDTRAMVDDVIGFAPSNHGTTAARDCAGGGCSAASTQQSDQSHFMAALNSAAETWRGISYTNIVTRLDETVQPFTSGFLTTGEGRITNVVTQDVCPSSTSEHLLVGLIDATAHALALDALGHDGPADPARVPPTTCALPFHEGINPTTAAQDGAAALESFNGYQAATVAKEPDLACYTSAAGCPAAARTCASRRRFAITVPRGARVTLNGKRVRVRGTKATIDLRGRARGTVVVRITRPGAARAQVRRFRTC